MSVSWRAGRCPPRTCEYPRGQSGMGGVPGMGWGGGRSFRVPGKVGEVGGGSCLRPSIEADPPSWGERPHAYRFMVGGDTKT